MKKKEIIIVAIILAVVVAAGIVLAVIFAKPAQQGKTTTTTSISTTATTKKGETTNSSGKQTTTKAAKATTASAQTSGAKVIGSDAIDTITALSNDQLGLKNKDDYSFMVSSSSFKIEGAKYVQVIAAKKKANHDGTIQIIPYGKYYISFDGSKILKQDLKTNKYTTIK
jgi:hypothetical protein